MCVCVRARARVCVCELKKKKKKRERERKKKDQIQSYMYSPASKLECFHSPLYRASERMLYNRLWARHEDCLNTYPLKSCGWVARCTRAAEF